MRCTLYAAVGLLGLGTAAAGEPEKPAFQVVAAVVNGEVIRLEQVDAVIRRRPPIDGPLTAAQTRQLRIAVASDMVDDLLMKQYLAKHAPAVEAAELDAHAAALAEAQRKLGKTPADFYRELGRTEAEVRAGWAAMLQFQRLVDKQATEPELRKYHADRRDRFDRGTVRAAHIVVRVGPDTPPGDRTAAREKLTRLRADVAAGKITFAAAARKHSMCPTAAAGGDLGRIGRRDPTVDEPVAAAAFALRVGEVSEVVETEFGLHLVTVTEKSPGPAARFEDVVEQVREAYTEDLRTALVARLRKAGEVRITVP